MRTLQPLRRTAFLAGVLALAAALGACSTPTPYAPADDRFGYKDSSIERDRYRVSFNGNSATDRETVETYLLYRAAELTLENGQSHFVIVLRDLDKNERYVHHSYYPFDYGTYGYYGYHGGYYFRRSVLAGPSDSIPIARYEAIAEIVIGGDELKAEGTDSYDAREVLSTLGPRIVRTPG
ncbi:CC0125/CC1285 family lipoprotein [Nisaea sp.]|uniref:CC0125/CC1285 family lipoprotein n=1 Tax=Nisaea sp. TaxID=2024842 RepID=UPI003B5190EE